MKKTKPTKTRKPSVTLYPDARTLAILQCPASNAGINGALEAYATLVSDATAVLARLLTAEDWTLLAYVCTGLRDFVSAPDASLCYALREEVAQQPQAKDYAKDLWPLDPQGGLDGLRYALTKVSELQAHAILLALRYYWSLEPEQALAQSWWEMPARLRAARESVAGSK